MKKLLIDANAIVPYYVAGRLNGIGRTTMELLQALAAIKNEIPFEIALFSQNMKGIGGRNTQLPFKNKHLYWPHREKFDKVAAALHLREMLYDYDVMHIPSNFEYVAHPEKCIVTIHDAMFFSYPEEMFNPEFARKHYTEMAQKAQAILTCSGSSKRDIVQYMGVPADKVTVAHWGVDSSLFYPRSRQDNPYCGSAPYFISVSCDTGRKNTISVIRAFKQFAKKDTQHHLILVWGNPPVEILQEAEACKDRIHFASHLSNESLAQLYGDATACFFPSLYEGFGLPVLEAFASGTPVVTCRNSSLVEVGGDAALYVEPYDLEAMASLMNDFERNQLDLPALQEQSIRQAAQFSWEACARRTLTVYKRCLGL